MSETRVCHVCGATLSAQDRFCEACGSQAAAPCRACGAVGDPTAVFCEHCGAVRVDDADGRGAGPAPPTEPTAGAGQPPPAAGPEAASPPDAAQAPGQWQGAPHAWPPPTPSEPAAPRGSRRLALVAGLVAVLLLGGASVAAALWLLESGDEDGARAEGAGGDGAGQEAEQPAAAPTPSPTVTPTPAVTPSPVEDDLDELVDVPDVTGLPVDDATRALEDAGLRVAAEAEEGTVVAQAPDDPSLPAETIVSLTVEPDDADDDEVPDGGEGDPMERRLAAASGEDREALERHGVDPPVPSWVVVLDSLDVDEYSAADAGDRVEGYLEEGLRPFVFHSDDFAPLNPGYWVVADVGYSDEEDAAEACRQIQDLTHCYQREIAEER